MGSDQGGCLVTNDPKISERARYMGHIRASEMVPHFGRTHPEGVYPYSAPPASRTCTYGGDSCPNAQSLLKNFVRWSTFCDKYEPAHCELAANIVRSAADQHRK